LGLACWEQASGGSCGGARESDGDFAADLSRNDSDGAVRPSPGAATLKLLKFAALVKATSVRDWPLNGAPVCVLKLARFRHAHLAAAEDGRTASFRLSQAVDSPTIEMKAKARMQKGELASKSGHRVKPPPTASPAAETSPALRDPTAD